MNYSAEQAQETFRQMGGQKRLALFTGAKFFFSSEKSMAGFNFKGSRKFNRIEIALNASDTYDVTFYQMGKYDVRKKEVISDVYCDQLCDLFQDMTDLTLGIRSFDLWN